MSEGERPSIFKENYAPIERWLTLIALGLSIAADRMIFAGSIERLWLCALLFLGTYIALNLRKLRWDGISCTLLANTVALCAWLVRGYLDWWNGLGVLLLLPSMMLFMQYSRSTVSPKRAFHHFARCCFGFFIQPLVAIFHFFGALRVGRVADRRRALRIAGGIGLAAALVGIVLPLLMSADGVFNYYVTNLMNIRFLTENRNDFWQHLIATALMTPLIYSFLSHSMDATPTAENPEVPVQFSLDPLVCGIGLSALLLVYALFAGIQFVYLFAGAGLPAHLTYANYAREGFAQMIAVALINLALFGAFITHVPRSHLFTALLAALLAASGLMLASGIVRLNLYLFAYGMTEARLFAYWTLLLACALVVLCALRLWKHSVPVIAVCVLLALVWATALIYANPDKIIERYNATHDTLHEQIVAEQRLSR